MAEQFGDDDDVDAGAQQVGGEGVGRQGEVARVVEDVGVGGGFVDEFSWLTVRSGLLRVPAQIGQRRTR
ncbi:hypothetical protein [Streptomyces sp.]|uniref:hypothetical protein n=1 Tax=Streptomyces sp. TaxID=1931 RepID=UPI002F95A78B